MKVRLYLGKRLESWIDDCGSFRGIRAATVHLRTHTMALCRFIDEADSDSH